MRITLRKQTALHYYVVNYITLNYTAQYMLCCTFLHCPIDVALRYSALHYIVLNYSALYMPYYITLHCTTLC